MTGISRHPPRAPDGATRDEVLAQVGVAGAAASAKKGDEIVVLDVGPIIAITDFFLIVSGGSERQVRTIVEEVERRLRDGHGIRPLRVEGLADARWVLLDYGDFFVHVFQRDVRAFYDLERLWSDAARVDWEELGAAS